MITFTRRKAIKAAAIGLDSLALSSCIPFAKSYAYPWNVSTVTNTSFLTPPPITIDSSICKERPDEAWTAGNGFTDDFYVYEDCKLQINGNRFAANGSTTGFEQQIQQAGVVAKTKNGKFSGKFEEGWCSTSLEIFSELTDIPSPEKLIKVTQ